MAAILAQVQRDDIGAGLLSLDSRLYRIRIAGSAGLS
jgi:hypothetical protein